MIVDFAGSGLPPDAVLRSYGEHACHNTDPQRKLVARQGLLGLGLWPGTARNQDPQAAAPSLAGFLPPAEWTAGAHLPAAAEERIAWRIGAMI
jgi:hypothetical protein